MANQIVADNTFLDDNGTVYTGAGKVIGTIRRSGRDHEAFDAQGKNLGTITGDRVAVARWLAKNV